MIIHCDNAGDETYTLLFRRCYGSHAKAERAEEKGDQKQGGFAHHHNDAHENNDNIVITIMLNMMM